MKTSMNVLGIQAAHTLQRIGETWQALIRAGKAPARVQIIGCRAKDRAAVSGMIEEAPQAEQILGIFTVQEAVLQEERLTTEIPQPNWQGGNVPFHPGLIEAGELHRRSEGKAGGRRTNRLMIVQKREDKRRRGEAANDLAQTKGRVRPKKCYLGSSLSPPPD